MHDYQQHHALYNLPPPNPKPLTTVKDSQSIRSPKPRTPPNLQLQSIVVEAVQSHCRTHKEPFQALSRKP